MKLILLLIPLLFIVIGCNHKFRYIASPDGKKHLTLFEMCDDTGQSFTYISYGKVKKIPDSYIKVRNRYFDSWHCLIEWKEEQAIIYQPYKNFEEFNLDKNMDLVEIYDTLFFHLFYHDDKNNYIKLNSYDKN